MHAASKQRVAVVEAVADRDLKSLDNLQGRGSEAQSLNA